MPMASQTSRRPAPTWSRPASPSINPNLAEAMAPQPIAAPSTATQSTAIPPAATQQQLDLVHEEVASAERETPVAAAAPAATTTSADSIEATAPAAMVAIPEPVAKVEPAPVSGGRASNDPRVNRREIGPVDVRTQPLQIEFGNSAAAQPDPKRAQPTRAGNDPRLQRGDTARPE